MDSALQALFSWQFLLFSLSIAAIVWFIRTVVEYFLPNADGNKLWEKLILPTMPLIFGTVIAFFAKAYPFPDGLTSASARLMFGGVGGMFSGLVYQVIKGMLKDKIQTYVASVAPPAVAPAPPVLPVDPGIGNKVP
jgi:hypothetical protein